MNTLWLAVVVAVALVGLGWVVLNPPLCQPGSPRIVIGGILLAGCK